MGTPRFVFAAYHPASGTERAYNGVGVGKRAAGAAGTQAVVGAKVAMEPSELLINAAVVEGITCLRGFDDTFGDGLPNRCRLGCAAK
jgi:hypothetical protein